MPEGCGDATSPNQQLILANIAALNALLAAATIDLAAVDALIDLIQADIGDASTSTLLSLYGILGNPGTSFTAQLARLLNAQLTRPYVIEEVEFDDVALVGPTNLSVLSIIPAFPTGAIKIKAYAVATLFISNQSVNAQDITPHLEAQVNAGGYNDVWLPGDIVTSCPAVIGTSTMIYAECDISAYFVNGQQTDLRFVVTQTNASSVHYTSEATIYLVYTL